MRARAKKRKRTMTLDGCSLTVKRSGQDYELRFENFSNAKGDRVAVVKLHASALGYWAAKIGVEMEKATIEAECNRDAVCRGFERGKTEARQ